MYDEPPRLTLEDQMSDNTALTTADIARELATTPKLLRTFLRSRNSGVGSGARYTFTASDLAELGDDFEFWMSQRSNPAAARKARKATVAAEMAASRARRGIDLDAPGLKPAAALADPEIVHTQETARVDRLEAMLKDAGLHISQMRDRDGWLARTI